MDSNQIVFTAHQLRKGLQEALTLQKRNATLKPSKSYRGQSLKEALDSIHYTVTETSTGVTAEAGIPLTVRFNDMKHLGRMKVYNKPLWGTLYDRTLQDIKYGYRDWIRQMFGSALADAMKKP